MIFQIIAAVICCCIFCFFLGAALAKSEEEPPKEQVKCENCTYRDVCLIEEDLKLVQDNPKERYCSLALEREGKRK